MDYFLQKVKDDGGNQRDGRLVSVNSILTALNVSMMICR